MRRLSFINTETRSCYDLPTPPPERKRRRHTTVHLYLILPILLALSVPLSAVSEEKNLTIISPHWEGIRYEFQWAFQDYYRSVTGKGISFTWLDVGGTSEILRFVRSEFDRRPEGINVDLFFGGGVEPYEELSRLKLLRPFKLPDVESLPPDISGAPLIGNDYMWYAPVVGSFGILCNSKVLELLKIPTPETWEDISKTQYYSWVASTDPRKSGSGHMIYEIILQAYGWQKGWNIIFAIGRNIRGFGAQSNQPAKDVESGEVACAFAYDTQAWWAQQKYGSERMPFILPRGLTALAPDAVGILKGAPNLKEAELFVEFLMSAAGQRLWIRPKGSEGGPRNYDLARMPVLPGIYSESSAKLVHFNPFTWHNEFTLDARIAAERWNILNDLLGTFIVEPHAALRASGETTAFPQVPSEQETMALAAKWSDPYHRDRAIRSWKDRISVHLPNTGRNQLLWLSSPWIFLLALIALRFLSRKARKRRSASLYLKKTSGIQ